MARTTIGQVKTTLADDYGKRRDGTDPDLTPYIDSASNMVTRLVADAQSKKNIGIDSATAELIERWLAAHYYTKSDPTYTSRSTAGKSGSFVRAQEEPEPYRNVAVDLDPSGLLNAYLRRQRADLVWLGRNPEDQTDYIPGVGR